jgi:hypothetical protein
MTKRFAALAVVAIVLMSGSALQAQAMSFGFMLGGSESLEDGVDLNLGDTVREVFFSTELEIDTNFRIKAGRVESESAERPGDLEYIQALIDYRFDEVFGSTTLFAGPALYRYEPDGDVEDESEYGFCGGVSGEFPVTRRFSLLAELTYHWVNFDDPYRFLTAAGGLKMRF